MEPANFQMVSRVLDVLKEGKIDVAGLLDTLCWGNQLAVVNPTVRHARTSLMHSDWLVTVMSCWLAPPQTSPGGLRVEGAKLVLVPLVINMVKGIINDKMEAIVEELEESADVNEQSVLGTMIEGV